ncbi:protein kinase-like domain-containing protein [Artemisia annua]|uniref:Protein kinase-like domain-containing protein n=1 Tax=Artemisia annua TaxID=35608 RepID=A0A2U1LSR4_ARTAN|nr:protein kinase-like domain-containing protein [Artemisia annua]
MRLIIAQDAAVGINLAMMNESQVLETNAYLAPEYINTGRLSSKIDVWSYGIFLEELITGRVRTLVQENTESINVCVRWVCGYPVVGKTSEIIADPRLEGKYSEKSIKKVADAEIAKKCLAKDPKLRPNMSEVLKMVKEALELEMLNQILPEDLTQLYANNLEELVCRTRLVKNTVHIQETVVLTGSI